MIHTLCCLISLEYDKMLSGGDIMKKFILILILITLAFFSYQTLTKIEIDDIISATLTDINRSLSTDEYPIVMEILGEDRNPINVNVAFVPKLSLKVNYKDNKTALYRLFIDYPNQYIYFQDVEENEFYLMNQKHSSQLFKRDYFDYILKDLLPTHTLEINGHNLESQSKETQVVFQDFSGNSIKKTFNQDKGKDINKYENIDSINFNATESTFLTVLRSDGEPVFSGTLKDQVFIPNRDGAYTYEFQVDYTEPFKARETLQYKILYDQKAQFNFSKTSVTQGEVLKVTVDYLNNGQIPFIESDLTHTPFYLSNDQYIAYLPLRSREKIGTYDLSYGVTDKWSETVTIDVQNRDFRTQYLYVNAQTMASSSNAEAYAEYNKYFYPVRKISAQESFIDGEFILPTEGRLTTEFGEGRYINDAITSYSHSGIDIGAPAGTDVKATNAGKVTLSRHFALTGNTIIIDHGQGLLSYYLHLDERYVSENDFVERGKIIGTVGSTGRSTGPHLHFGMSIFTTYVEPGYFIYNEVITKENYKKLFQ